MFRITINYFLLVSVSPLGRVPFKYNTRLFWNMAAFAKHCLFQLTPNMKILISQWKEDTVIFLKHQLSWFIKKCRLTFRNSISMQFFFKSRRSIPCWDRASFKACVGLQFHLGFLSLRSRACWARSNWKAGDPRSWHLASRCPASSLMNSHPGLVASSLAGSSLASSLRYVFFGFSFWLPHFYAQE